VIVLLYIACRWVKVCCWVQPIGPPTCQQHHTFKPVIKGAVFYLRELYIQDNPHITKLGVLSIVNLLVKYNMWGLMGGLVEVFHCHHSQFLSFTCALSNMKYLKHRGARKGGLFVIQEDSMMVLLHRSVNNVKIWFSYLPNYIMLLQLVKSRTTFIYFYGMSLEINTIYGLWL